MPEGAIYVGRPSTWGNGYLVGMTLEIVENGVARRTVITRAMSIELFRGYAGRRLALDPDWLTPLIGHDLACWCELDQPCHVDVLLELVAPMA